MIWLWKPDDVSFTLAFALFSLVLLPFGFMSAYFYGVINDNYVLAGNPTFKMMNDANMFIKDTHKNVSSHELIDKYS